MATHHNNVEGAVVEHNKRVSFGAEEHVQMIVYDDGINDDYSINHSSRLQQQVPSRHTFTEPDAPPSRVRVHAEQAEIPRPISPPAHIAPVEATPSSSIAPAAAHPTASMVQMVNSPPLPSFLKRAEHDAENPFRPDEQLYHEVDPIVEMYRQRPFPPSPSHGSPVPPHQQHQQQQQAATPSRQSAQSSQTPNRGEMVANGGGGGRHSSLAEARRETQNATASSYSQQPLLDQSADGIGPPGHVEVVRLPEKKKRACCSLQ